MGIGRRSPPCHPGTTFDRSRRAWPSHSLRTDRARDAPGGRCAVVRCAPRRDRHRGWRAGREGPAARCLPPEHHELRRPLRHVHHRPLRLRTAADRGARRGAFCEPRGRASRRAHLPTIAPFTSDHPSRTRRRSAAARGVSQAPLARGARRPGLRPHLETLPALCSAEVGAWNRIELHPQPALRELTVWAGTDLRALSSCRNIEALSIVFFARGTPGPFPLAMPALRELRLRGGEDLASVPCYPTLEVIRVDAGTRAETLPEALRAKLSSEPGPR